MRVFMRLLFAIAVLVGALVLAPLGTQAQPQRSIRLETMETTTPNGKPAAALLINGEVVVRLAKEQRQKDPLRAVSVAAALLAQAYRRGNPELTLQPSDDTGTRIALYLDGKLLLLASDVEAKAWGVSVEQLANTWRNNILAALGKSSGAGWSKPAATPNAQDVQLGPAPSDNATRPPVKPAAPADHARPPAGGNTQPAGGQQSGGGLLTISGGHNVYEPPSNTSIERAALPGQLTAQITGSRLSHAEAASCIEQVLRNYAQLPAEAGLSWKITQPEEADLTPARGQSEQLTIEYSVTGRGGVQTPGTASLLLKNTALATPKESLTFFSNHPEGVSKPQLLYFAELPARQAGRLVLHHQNQGRGGMQIIARVVNTGAADGALHIIPGTCDPDINTFYVGFKSAELFWNNLNSGSGYVLPVPAGGQAIITSQRLPVGYTASGYYKLTNLGASALRLETLTLPPGAAPQSAPYQDSADASQGVFPAPYINVTESYETGDDWLYLRLGQDSQDSMVDKSSLDGSYGVTYSFSVEIHNAKSEPALVFAVLRASAGEVKGQFFIDDEYIATPLVASGDEVLLKEIPLRPGQTKLLKIKALPLNGGFYPASTILRETRMP